MLEKAQPGVAAFQEHTDYWIWRYAPRRPALSCCVEAVLVSWRVTVGEPNIALDLLCWLATEGTAIEICSLVDGVSPASFVWRWPTAFIEGSSARLVEKGHLSAEGPTPRAGSWPPPRTRHR